MSGKRRFRMPSATQPGIQLRRKATGMPQTKAVEDKLQQAVSLHALHGGGAMG
jgi:hypothetical protein